MKRIFLGALAVSALAACSTNPITGRSQLMIVSEETAISSSVSAYNSMVGGLSKKKQIEAGTEREKKVREITDRLVAQAIRFRPDSANWKWEVQVINDPKTVNAFCMAGGKMAIYTGMWDKLNASDEEIAMVMGHEISHALAGHTQERMSVAMTSQVLATGVALAISSSESTRGLAMTGTQLEEQASTAHAVGLKHTILGSFVTLGSLINFCDVLMTGGTSREDHSEVGSGYIHFNFTPWGKRGDKATASLVGDVVNGMLLRQPRIFLGGAGGMVGPRRIGFGAVAAAGQVLRADLEPRRLFSQATPTLDQEFSPGRLDRAEKRAPVNVRYVAELVAMRAFYRQVRRSRVPAAGPQAHLGVVYGEALRTLDRCIDERLKRFEAFLRERGRALPALVPDADPPCPLALGPADPYQDHVEWVRALGAGDVDALTRWLAAVADGVVERGRAVSAAPAGS